MEIENGATSAKGKPLCLFCGKVIPYRRKPGRTTERYKDRKYCDLTCLTGQRKKAKELKQLMVPKTPEEIPVKDTEDEALKRLMNCKNYKCVYCLRKLEVRRHKPVYYGGKIHCPTCTKWIRSKMKIHRYKAK